MCTYVGYFLWYTFITGHVTVTNEIAQKCAINYLLYTKEQGQLVLVIKVLLLVELDLCATGIYDNTETTLN